MIRLGLPFPTLYNMSLRAHLVSARLTRAIRRMLLADESEPEAYCVVTRKAATPFLEPVDVEKFERRYQDLVDLFCSAAKDGATIERCERYMDLQDWFGRNY